MKTNYLGTSMLDILFENRNKAYGAYVLRQDYDKSHRMAMIFSFGSVFLLLSGNFISERLKGAHHSHNIINTVIQFHDVPLVQRAPEVKPKITPPPAQAANRPVIRNTEMKVVAQSQRIEDSLPPTHELANVDAGVGTDLSIGTSMGIGGSNGSAAVLDPAPPPAPAAPTVFRWVEKMPEFPGGESKLLKFLSDHAEYPPVERDLELSGKVSAEFTVNEDGSVSDIKVLKSPSPGFDREAIRVIKLLPRFTPGMQQNKPVKVRMVLPFDFKLND